MKISLKSQTVLKIPEKGQTDYLTARKSQTLWYCYSFVTKTSQDYS